MPPEEEPVLPVWSPNPRLRVLYLVDNRFALIVDRIPDGWKKENLEAVKEFADEVGAAGVLVYWDEIQLPDDDNAL